MKTRTLAVAAIVVLMTLAGGCDRQEAAWQEAREADTISAYEAYLDEFGDSDQAGEAGQRLGALRSAALWEETAKTSTAEAYGRFLEQFPDSEQADEARARLAELEGQSEWAGLRSSTDLGALRAFADRYRDQPAGAEARQRIAELEAAAAREQARLEAERKRREEAARTHRVQLAAFRSETDAQRGVARLAERLAATLGETALEIGQSGSLYLVRTAPLEEPDAGALCGRLKERNQDCLVVSR